MRDKKKIFALVLFILMGFFMFTFANPSDGIDELTTPVDDEEKDSTKTTEKETPVNVNNVVNQVLAVVDNAPVITVSPKEVKILRGTDYDVNTGVMISDDKDTNLKPIISMTSLIDAKAGSYTITYTVTDSANNTATATRIIKVLEPNDDEDNDGYTNKEESDNDSNFDDEKIIPIDETPELSFESDEVTLEYGSSYKLMANILVSDDFDSLESGNLEVTKDLDDSEVPSLSVGNHIVTYTAKDRAGNETTKTRKIIIVDTTAPKLALNGSSSITLEAGVDTYAELNATATDAVDGTWTVEPEFIHYSVNGKYVGSVDKVDLTKVGTYKIQYSCTDKAGNACEDAKRSDHKYVLRVVNVVDTTAPKLALNGSSNITLEAGVDTYTELNATATDILDGTWTVEPEFIHYSVNGKYVGSVNKVDLTKAGTYKIQYSCTDKAGNVCEDAKRSDHKYVLRVVNVVDTTAPKLALNGSSNITLEAGVDTYTELNATATDILDGAWTVKPEFINYSVNGKYVGSVNKVDLTKVGTYKIQYSCTDKAGNACEDAKRSDHKYVLRVVNVVDTTKPIITGITNNGEYQDTVTFDTNEAIKTYIVDGNSYTDSTVSKVINTEGTHTVKVIDLSGNSSDEITFTIYKIYTVTFKDYDGSVIDTQSVRTNGSYTLPNMTGRTYTSKNITYVFAGWDKSIDKVTQNLDITATYDISSAYAVVYEFTGATRPLNGAYSGSMSDYQSVNTTSPVEISLTDQVKQIITSGSSVILTYNLNEVLGYIVDNTVLPTPTNANENFTKYEWYVLKFEQNSGWHLDGQIVVDTTALNNYRNAAISQINDYALSFGFDISSVEITGIVNASGINGLNTKSSIDAAVISAKGAVDSLFAGIKLSAKNEIQTTINNQLFKNNYVAQANAIRDTANGNIDNALTLTAISSIKTKAITDITSLKALSLKTFTATITTIPGDGDYKYLTINDVASDVIITRVDYIYGLVFERNEEKYTGNIYLSPLLVNKRLQNADKVRIEYTKNGISYFAKYNVNREWFTISGVSKYADTYVG